MNRSLFILPLLALAAVSVSAGELLAPRANAELVQDSYLVILKDSAHLASFGAKLDRLVERENAREGVQVAHEVKHEFHLAEAALAGFAGTFSAEVARKLADDDKVAYVEREGKIKRYGVQENPGNWGLSRISQEGTKYPAPYYYPDSAGKGINIYVVDSGVQIDHPGALHSRGLNTAPLTHLRKRHHQNSKGAHGGVQRSVARSAQILMTVTPMARSVPGLPRLNRSDRPRPRRSLQSRRCTTTLAACQMLSRRSSG